MKSRSLPSPECTAASRASTIRQALADLTGSDAWLWVTFESGKCRKVIEVAIDQGRFILNIPHGERGGLLPKLESLGFTLPPWWRVKKDKSKGLLSSGFLEIEADGQDQDKIATFVERLGREVFAWKDDEPLTACLQQ